MPYRPTGRSPGRPRGPVTPDGKLDRARKTLPHVKAFPHLRRAVDRAMRLPNATVLRAVTHDSRDVDVEHRYTPAERGQILSFVWWVYVNRASWSRAKLTAAVTAVSPLMMFSSTFFSDMTGLPKDTATKHMIKSPDMEVKRVTGTCDIWVVHHLLEMAMKDLGTYRDSVRELSVAKGVPPAMLARISGVPNPIIRRPERGIQFFPEKPDLEIGLVCGNAHMRHYLETSKEKRRNYDPDPGDQHAVRDALAGKELGSFHTTAAPIPGEDNVPHHLAIPGLPSARDAGELGPEFFRIVREWEFRYQLPASPYLGS